MPKSEYEISLTEFVAGLGKGLIIAPEFNLNLTGNGGACPGTDCQSCGLCNGEVE